MHFYYKSNKKLAVVIISRHHPPYIYIFFNQLIIILFNKYKYTWSLSYNKFNFVLCVFFSNSLRKTLINCLTSNRIKFFLWKRNKVVEWIYFFVNFLFWNMFFVYKIDKKIIYLLFGRILSWCVVATVFCRFFCLISLEEACKKSIIYLFKILNSLLMIFYCKIIDNRLK